MGKKSINNDAVIGKIGEAVTPSQEEPYGIWVNPDSLIPQGGPTSWEEIKNILTGTIEFMPYPRQLKGDPKLMVLVDENGLNKQLPYNRWGLVGDMVIVRAASNGSLLRWSNVVIEAVCRDLMYEQNGYMDRASGILCPFRLVNGEVKFIGMDMYKEFLATR